MTNALKKYDFSSVSQSADAAMLTGLSVAAFSSASAPALSDARLGDAVGSFSSASVATTGFALLTGEGLAMYSSASEI